MFSSRQYTYGDKGVLSQGTLHFSCLFEEALSVVPIYLRSQSRSSDLFVGLILSHWGLLSFALSSHPISYLLSSTSLLAFWPWTRLGERSETWRWEGCIFLDRTSVWHTTRAYFWQEKPYFSGAVLWEICIVQLWFISKEDKNRKRSRRGRSWSTLFGPCIQGKWETHLVLQIFLK